MINTDSKVSVQKRLAVLFNQIHANFVNDGGSVTDLMATLIHRLYKVRRQSMWSDWRLSVCSAGYKHKISGILCQDPFTRRAFEKPRGYPGDAEMLDYIYGYSDIRDVAESGRAILACTTNCLTAKSVRNRRDILAGAIDAAAAEKRLPRILSLACGHLREAHLSKAVSERRTGDFVALDQDERSLAVVSKTFNGSGIRTVRGAVLDLDFNRLGRFDLIYAAGLYDYLWNGAAKELTAYIFEMLNPGGKLLIANVMPHIPDAGYLEAIMDWWLVYRTTDQVKVLADSIPAEAIADRRTFTDSIQNIAFLEVKRKVSIRASL